jgi:DNA-binding LacI/PurR family transcriptional regulator
MADVARLAEVHASTVSLALRNHPSIPEATRARVRHAAEQVGYQTHPLVSALMSFRRSAREVPRHTTLAFVTSSRPTNAWRESRTLRDQLAGAQERAQRLGYHIEEFPLNAPGVSPARFNQMLRNRGIIGLIVAPLRNDTDTVPIQWEHFAAVAIAFTLQRPDIPRVGSDHGQSIRLAIAECRRRGYRRIGLAVQRSIMERVEQQWLAGFLVEHAGISPRSTPAPLLAEPWSESTFLKWFKAQRPEVVLTGGDYASVLSWLKCAGVDVPGQVGVVSLDVHERDGSIAGIDQHSEELGAAVVDHLIARLHRNERGAPPRAVRLHVMGEWREGATIRPSPA